MDRMGPTFITGATNFTDYYYPSAWNSTTSGIGLDSTQLSADPPRLWPARYREPDAGGEHRMSR